MPSPLAHAAAGYAVYRIFRSSDAIEPELFTASLAFSLLPDLDSVAGLIGQNFAHYHNNVSHSVGFMIGAGVLAGTLFHRRQEGFFRWYLVGLMSYGFHLALDYWSTRRGILLLWPFSNRRFTSPKRLFYGLKWGRGIKSATHIWTAFTELIFGLMLVTTIRWLTKRQRQ
jgi:hypothetical protein